MSVPGTDASGEARFRDALAQGRLLAQRCLDCQAARIYPQAHCPHCLSSRFEPLDCGGGGTIYSHTTIHRAPHPGFHGKLPYTLALIDLDEGARLLAEVRGRTEDIAVGARVRACFDGRVDPAGLPWFEPLPPG